MSTTDLMYPILIILFCVIIVYGLLVMKYNNKLIKTIESFSNLNDINNINNIKKNLENNIQTITSIANGTWTTMYTTVDSNYNTNYLMTININTQNINNSSLIASNTNGNNIGTIIINYPENNINTTMEFDITSIIGTNMLAVSKTTPSTSLHIDFVGLLDDPSKNIKGKYKDYYVTDTQMCYVSLFMFNRLIRKFVSYKVYNNKVKGKVYRIIKSKDFYVDDLPPIFDYDTYNVLVNSYQYPTNYISFEFGTNNTNIYNIINDKYFGQLQFSIQRVFESPTGNEIITKSSPPIKLNAINNGQIPNTIVIVPFEQDKETNNLESFFKPIATIVYLYKFNNVETTYGYSDANMSIVPSSVLNLRNNSSGNMFGNNIEFDKINTVYQNNNFEFDMVLFKRVDSDLNTSTIIPFSTIYNLL